ncbi:MAG: 8-amino-7-oxononanoate synthase [Polyangiaceae bacterium]
MPARGPLASLTDEIARLAERGLLRDEPPAGDEAPARGFCSNDYLGLASAPAVDGPRGAGASRLLGGDHAAHHALEAGLASLVGHEAALLFSSGFAANLGTMSALVGPDDLVVSDALNHASIIDGCRLSRARVEVTPHGDVGAVARALEGPARRKWVVCESYFSMDADQPDLRALRRVCDEAGAGLVVDEAHALGVLGPEGRGLCAEAGVRADVLVGTLGKSFGAQGAFVAGPRALRTWLWNRARSHVFSTGLAPVVAASALASLEQTLAHPELRERVLSLSGVLRGALAERGVPARGFGHIVPVVLGDPRPTVEVAALLRERGVRAMAVRPPTVPEGTSRLRFTVTALHTPERLATVAEQLADVLRALNVRALP